MAPIIDQFLLAETIAHTTQHLVQQMLTNITFPHRQLPKALYSLCYETSTKDDTWARKKGYVLTQPYHICQDI